MSYTRLAVAAALFLAATCGKIYLPERAEEPIAAVQELIDRDGFALPLPEEAATWLDLP